MNIPVRNHITRFFTLFLIAGVCLGYGLTEAGSSLSPQPPKLADAVCNIDAQNGSNGDVSNLYNAAKQLPVGNNCGTQTVSCNTTLQLFAVASTSLMAPWTESKTIQLGRPSFSTQIFVFQEPDPPKVG